MGTKQILTEDFIFISFISLISVFFSFLTRNPDAREIISLFQSESGVQTGILILGTGPRDEGEMGEMG